MYSDLVLRCGGSYKEGLGFVALHLHSLPKHL